MRLLISTLLAGLAFCYATPTLAQNNLLVVGTCGTLPLAYLPGAVRTGTQDVNGRACGVATVVGAGDATAANQVLQLAQETAFNTALGLQADAACATDNGTCTAIALLKRNNQRLTTTNTTLGTPFQAGGSIGNTAFGISGTLPAFAATPTVNIGTAPTITVTLPTTPLIASGNGAVRAPTSEAAAGIAPVVSGSAETGHVICAAACNLSSLTMTIGATAGYAMVFDATAVPSNGAVTPKWCYPVSSNGTLGGIDKDWDPPTRYATGASVAFSSTGCFTLTLATAAFIAGNAK